MLFDAVPCHTERVTTHPARFAVGGFSNGRAAARWQAGLGALGPVAVALLLPDPRAEVALLRDTRPDVVLGAVAVLAATLVVWALVGWAAVVVGAAAASRLPGAAGRLGRHALLAVTPSALRGVVIAAAGVSIVAGLGACGSMAPGAPGSVTIGAAPVTGAPPDVPADAHGGVLLDLDWPLGALADSADATEATAPAVEGVDSAPVIPPAGDEPTMTESSPAPAPERPAAARLDPPDGPARHGVDQSRPAADESAGAVASVEGAAHSAAVESTGSAPVVVRRGDTLWAIAAAQLPDDASAAQIDRSWREWYAANRSVIGSDPNLVIPGQELSPPPPRHSDPAATSGSAGGVR